FCFAVHDRGSACPPTAGPSWRHAEQLPALFNGTPIGTRILA
ncbi:hypothetical protein, partial [Klebsiella pneumoniae]